MALDVSLAPQGNSLPAMAYKSAFDGSCTEAWDCGVCAGISFDMQRMDKGLHSPRIEIPSSLTKEEIRAFITKGELP